MKKREGFTLIELMVVVAIIGFLSTIGMVVFADAQARGRDTKRRGDIDSIAKTLEIHKTDSGGYQPLDTTWFGSSGGLPTADPKGNLYCISATTDSTVTLSDPTDLWTTTSCPANYSAVSDTVPSANSIAWRLCTYLEKPAGNYCRYSVQ